MEWARDKLPITHDIIRRKKDAKSVSGTAFFASASCCSSRIVIMRPVSFKSSFGPRFEFEARGLWPICVIKKTLKLDCSSAKV